MRFNRRQGFAAVVFLGVLAGVFVALHPWNALRGGARRAWKDAALGKIQQRVSDKAWQARAIGALPTTRPSVIGGWVGDEILTMRNGDWIVCQNICRKEDGRIPDLFLGYGSDGRWYYSTFHFCRGKVVLRNEGQPDDLPQFVRRYWLTPFDGRSDQCLTTTWTPGQPWGEER